jgi:uncharacterized membrane protein
MRICGKPRPPEPPAGVAVVVVDSHQSDGGTQLGGAALVLASVALSWMLVQTLFTLRYAEHYYGGRREGGVSFNQDEPPQYTDFTYLATSIGMTYQVSDTNLENPRIRREALKHSLLSYLFGTVILAATLNLVLGLPERRQAYDAGRAPTTASSPWGTSVAGPTGPDLR